MKNTMLDFMMGMICILLTITVSEFYAEKDIEETLKFKTFSKTWLFWLIWCVLTGGMEWGFYYLDNRWLN